MAYTMEYKNLNTNEKYNPTTLRMQMDWQNILLKTFCITTVLPDLNVLFLSRYKCDAAIEGLIQCLTQQYICLEILC